MRWRDVLLALAGAAAALLPLALGSSFLLHVCILVLMSTLLGAAWNVLGSLSANGSCHSPLSTITG